MADASGLERGAGERARLAGGKPRRAFRRPHDALGFPRAVLARIQILRLVHGPAGARRFCGRARHGRHADRLPRPLVERRRPGARRLRRIRRRARAEPGAGALPQAARGRRARAPPATPTRIRRSAWARSAASWPPSTPWRSTASAARSSISASRRRRCAARSRCMPRTAFMTASTRRSASTRIPSRR